jgi:STE24 endopeptidase
MDASLFTWIFIAALLLSLLVKGWLLTRQVRHVKAHRESVPLAFKEQVSLKAHQKAADYTAAKAQLEWAHMVVGAAVLIGWTLLGGLHQLNQWLLIEIGERFGAMAYQMALLVIFGLISSVLDLPFSLYSTFHLEQRFGFNRMTLKMVVVDGLKGLVVSAVIGLPIIWVVLWLMGSTGPLWWLWAWGVWIGFNLLLLVIYPTVIAPWFNRFEPLKDESLKERVLALMQRCGFTSRGLYVMDGSKRSAHANAYFTGFGAAKRVVFYDTLLKQLDPDEVEAVLAHELGHFKHKHIVKRIVVMFALSGLGFALLGWCSSQVGFYTSLGVVPSLQAPNDALALLLFMLVTPVFTYFISPVSAQLSRRHEFQADAFAAQHAQAASLGSALLKLYKDNASTLTPDPMYAKFYYSHPPASERLAALRLVTSNAG